MNRTEHSSEQPVRLALCITGLEMGGAERCLMELATRIDRRRFDPVVYSLGAEPPKDRSIVPALERAGVPYHCLRLQEMWQAPWGMMRLRRLFAIQRPQIVQTFLFHANIMGRLAARSIGVPHIVSGVRVAEKQKDWHLRVDRLTSSLVERHVCVSRSVARFMHETAGLPPERLAVIPNSVDLARFAAAKPIDLSSLGIPQDRRAILFVGRLDQQKGIEWLLEMAPQILNRLPLHHLLLVGDGPLRGWAEARLAELQLKDRVHLAGWRADVPQLLKSAELLVLPSNWEGMPNVILEAMAAERAVVSTDVEGVREVLGPLAEGQVVPLGESKDFIAAVERLATDESLAQSVGLGNRRRVEQHFSPVAMVSAYERLYNELLAAR